MDYNLVFKLLNKANKQGKLKKISELNYYLDNKIIEPNQIRKKVKKVKMVFFKFKLNDFDYLFFKDYPLNVLINLGFVIGDGVEVFEVVLASGSKYYTIEEYVDFIKEDVVLVSKVSSEVVKHKIYGFDFEQPKFIKALKSYYEKNFSRSLSQVFFLRNNEKVFRCFCPNLYGRDFQIAKKLNLPIVSYVENNFIRDSKIHVKDLISILDRIEPYEVLEEEQVLRVERRTKKVVFRDVSREYFLILDENEIYDKIKNSYFYNKSSLSVFKRIKFHNRVRVTNLSGEFKAPIWISDLDCLTFDSVEEFERVCGLSFDKRSFDKAFLISKQGKQVDFENKFLRDVFFECDGSKIFFKKIDDLVLSVFGCDGPVRDVVFLQSQREEQVRDFFNLTKKFLRVLILKSIEFNKIVSQDDLNDLFLSFSDLNKRVFFRYLMSVKNHLRFFLDKFRVENQRVEVVKFFSQKAVFLVKFTSVAKEEDLGFLMEIFGLFLSLCEQIDESFYDDIFQIFKEFFKDLKIESSFKSKIDVEFESVVESFLQFKDCRFHIFFKRDFCSLGGTSYVQVDDLTDFEVFYKLDKRKVLRDFPKNFLKIESFFYGFTQFDLKCIFEQGGVLKYKNVSLDVSYFTKYKKFFGYKRVCENDFFLILK